MFLEHFFDFFSPIFTSPSVSNHPISNIVLAEAYELLKENLYTRDDAVIGEAAGLAMGLVMLGTKSALALEHMVTVSCHDIVF